MYRQLRIESKKRRYSYSEEYTKRNSRPNYPGTAAGNPYNRASDPICCCARLTSVSPLARSFFQIANGSAGPIHLGMQSISSSHSRGHDKINDGLREPSLRDNMLRHSRHRFIMTLSHDASAGYSVG